MDSISLFLGRLPSRIYNTMETIQFVLSIPFSSEEKLRSGCASEEEIGTWSTRAHSGVGVYILLSQFSNHFLLKPWITIYSPCFPRCL